MRRFNWPAIGRSALASVLSRPVWIGAAALFVFLWFQEWSAHRMVAKFQAAHYVTHETVESTKWERVTADCPAAGGKVQVATKMTDEEIRRLAKEHGLELAREVPGAEREVLVFRDASGQEIRALGEKQIAPAPWGGKLFAGLNQQGALWADMKPLPEPFQEKLGAWGGFVKASYSASGAPYRDSVVEPRYGAGLVYEWRRYGRWIVAPGAEASWGKDSGWLAEVNLKLERRSLPLAFRTKP